MVVMDEKSLLFLLEELVGKDWLLKLHNIFHIILYERLKAISKYSQIFHFMKINYKDKCTCDTRTIEVIQDTKLELSSGSIFTHFLI